MSSFTFPYYDIWDTLLGCSSKTFFMLFVPSVHLTDTMRLFRIVFWCLMPKFPHFSSSYPKVFLVSKGKDNDPFFERRSSSPSLSKSVLMSTCLDHWTEETSKLIVMMI